MKLLHQKVIIIIFIICVLSSCSTTKENKEVIEHLNSLENKLESIRMKNDSINELRSRIKSFNNQEVIDILAGYTSDYKLQRSVFFSAYEVAKAKPNMIEDAISSSIINYMQASKLQVGKIETIHDILYIDVGLEKMYWNSDDSYCFLVLIGVDTLETMFSISSIGFPLLEKVPDNDIAFLTETPEKFTTTRLVLHNIAYDNSTAVLVIAADMNEGKFYHFYLPSKDSYFYSN